MAHKDSYRRNLPHFTPESATYFITTRLAGSLPESVLDQLKRDHRDLIGRKRREPSLDLEMLRHLQKRYLVELDKALDQCTEGPTWLAQSEVCAAVKNEIMRLEHDGIIDVWCYSIMPNHLHILFTLRSGELGQAMQLLKGRCSIVANRILKRRGAFWQHESYDHVVRPNEVKRIVRYILLNPVKAGLVDEWFDWMGNYLRPDSIVI